MYNCFFLGLIYLCTYKGWTLCKPVIHGVITQINGRGYCPPCRPSFQQQGCQPLQPPFWSGFFGAQEMEDSGTYIWVRGRYREIDLSGPGIGSMELVYLPTWFWFISMNFRETHPSIGSYGSYGKLWTCRICSVGARLRWGYINKTPWWTPRGWLLGYKGRLPRRPVPAAMLSTSNHGVTFTPTKAIRPS